MLDKVKIDDDLRYDEIMRDTSASAHLIRQCKSDKKGTVIMCLIKRIPNYGSKISVIYLSLLCP